MCGRSDKSGVTLHAARQDRTAAQNLQGTEGLPCARPAKGRRLPSARSRRSTASEGFHKAQVGAAGRERTGGGTDRVLDGLDPLDSPLDELDWTGLDRRFILSNENRYT